MDYSNIAEKLDALLGSVDLSNTTEEGVARQALPDGYYLCQVEKAELTESKSGNPMIVIEYSVIEDGQKTSLDDDGNQILEIAKGTKDQRIFCNYVLTNDLNTGFFVSDMLKFQDPETDEPLFTKEDFSSTQDIVRICETLTAGGVIYLMLQTVEKTNSEGEKVKDQKKKPITWKRARKLELI